MTFGFTKNFFVEQGVANPANKNRLVLWRVTGKGTQFGIRDKGVETAIAYWELIVRPYYERFTSRYYIRRPSINCLRRSSFGRFAKALQ